MARSINLQANKVASIVTINYSTPSSSNLDSVQSSSSDTTNYNQINEPALRNCNMTGSGALINLGNHDQHVNPFDSETTDRSRSGFIPESRYSSSGGSNLRYNPYPRDERVSSYENTRAESRRNVREDRYFQPNNRTDVGHERSFHRYDRLDAEHQIYPERDNRSDVANGRFHHADNTYAKTSEKRYMPHGDKMSSARNNDECAWTRTVRITSPTSERQRSSRIQESDQSDRMNTSHGLFCRSSTPKSYRGPSSDSAAKNNYRSGWLRMVRPTTPISESSRFQESDRPTPMDSSQRHFSRSSTPESYRTPPSDFRYGVFEEDDGYGLANWNENYKD